MSVARAEFLDERLNKRFAGVVDPNVELMQSQRTSLAAPIVGYFIDRFGPKPIMLTAALMAGIGYILFSWVNSYTTFLIVYLGVISIAFTASFVHAPTVIANSWFIRLRARAMTVVSAAVPVGGAIITPVLAIVVTALGWRWGAFLAAETFNSNARSSNF